MEFSQLYQSLMHGLGIVGVQSAYTKNKMHSFHISLSIEEDFSNIWI